MFIIVEMFTSSCSNIYCKFTPLLVVIHEDIASKFSVYNINEMVLDIIKKKQKKE